MGVTPFQSHTGLPRTKVVPRRAPLASSRNSFDAGSTDSARSGIPLPAGHGMFLPGQRSDEFLVYGPGAHGFQMARWRSGRQSTALIPYMGATPPILANGWGAFTGSEVTLHGRPVAAPKMLGVPATAGALPSPTEDSSTNSVLQQDDEQAMYISPATKSPRRSLKMQFTCNRCTTRNVIEVNPHAYHAGSVFVQCGGCKVRHKLVDHLNVAREYNLEQDGEYVTAGGTAEDRVRAVMSERMLPKPF